MSPGESPTESLGTAGAAYLVLERGDARLRIHRRTAAVVTVTTLLLVALAVVGMMLGDYGLSPTEVGRALLGRAEDPLANYFVRELRAPRVLAAVVVGAALGVAGAQFQTITHNPLGSPDIIGFTIGAATGALIMIIVVGAGPAAVSAGALLGGLATAALVLGLSGRHHLSGVRLVLIGIGVGAALAALNTLLVVRASLEAAQVAAHWLAGSLNAMSWTRLGLLAALVLPLLVLSSVLARPLTMLELGDDLAISGGVIAGRVRTSTVLVAVALVSLATAATGPIGFIALAAPQIYRRLAATPSLGVLGPALTGAVLVLASDLIAQRLLAPTELAVGAVTGALGGVYLIGLLALQWRTR